LQRDVFFAPPPPHYIYKPEYKEWTVSGNVLTDKLNGEAVALPAATTFNGSGEVNRETGAGSISGTISVPSFTSSVDLGGSHGEASMGMTVTPVGTLTATATKGEGGLEQLSAPLKVNIAFTSINEHPIECKTAEPISLNLTDELGLEELLTQGWSFTGTAAIPEIKCEEHGRGDAVEDALNSAFSSSENHFSLAVTAPASR
jgi:hypothetical protein